MRKFLSVLLAMAMVLSLTVTGLAADNAVEAKAEMAGKTVILHTKAAVLRAAATAMQLRARRTRTQRQQQAPWS